MPTEPIAISTTPPNPSHPTLAPNPNTTPSSDLSISPQTPFLTQPGMSPSSATPTPTISQGFFKWAASTLPKSPPVQQRGFDLPAVTVADHETDLEHESYDSFEYGDFSDLKLRPWGGGRRAVSMSMPSGQGASGIGSMLKGFGESPNPAQSPPAAGVMADKYSKGQGVLRRLSFSGANYRVRFHPSLPGVTAD